MDMEQICPTLTMQQILCVEAAAGPCAVVVFGASGDLAHRKLLPGIFELFRRSLLSDRFYVLGAGRTAISDGQFRQNVCSVLTTAANPPSKEQIDAFAARLYYISGDYGDSAFYNHIKARLVELDAAHGIDLCRIFYLAVPPPLYTSVAKGLGQAGLAGRVPNSRRASRLVVEKPFGRDLRSAAELNDVLTRYFDESQVYRIDHYLGKETVQNILVFRFANTIFEPVWNRNYIDSVQITIAETIGVEHRAGYYDKSGALRDIFQNHMLQMLALVAMEPPTSFDADRLHDEKVKLLRSVRPFAMDKLESFIVRGQYGPGKMDATVVPGYRQEPDVAPDSTTETFVAAKVFIDNWRWKGVPFYLRTGKRLKKKTTEIVVTFRRIPHSMFYGSGLEDIPPNILVLQIQPKEGISLSFQAKRPGSKICIDTLNMSFSYGAVFGVEMPDPYQRLLLDCMLGDQTLFTRYDAVQVAWQLLGPVLDAWEKGDSAPVIYPAGSESFAYADRLMEADGRNWRNLTSS
jgi:glucose-6-phosphate 1-dehydrogenase